MYMHISLSLYIYIYIYIYMYTHIYTCIYTHREIDIAQLLMRPGLVAKEAARPAPARTRGGLRRMLSTILGSATTDNLTHSNNNIITSNDHSNMNISNNVRIKVVIMRRMLYTILGSAQVRACR